MTRATCHFSLMIYSKDNCTRLIKKLIDYKLTNFIQDRLRLIIIITILHHIVHGSLVVNPIDRVYISGNFVLFLLFITLLLEQNGDEGSSYQSDQHNGHQNANGGSFGYVDA